MRAQVRRQPLRLVEIGDIEGDHERVLRTRDHASTSSSSSTAPNPVGTLSRPRTSAGEASRFVLQVAHDPLRHGDRRARVDQGGRSHLHRPRAREHRFDRVVPRPDAAHRDHGRLGDGARHLEHRAQHHRLDRRSRQVPGDPAEGRPELRRPHRHGGRRSTDRDPGDAGAHHGGRDLAEVRRVHRQLREHGHQRHASHRARDLGGAIDVRAEDLPTELIVGAREIDLERRDLRAALQRPGESHVFLQRRAGDRDHHVRSGPGQSRQFLFDERVDARVLQAGRPHDPGGGLGDPRRGRTTIGLERDAAAHDRADLAQVDEAAELAPGAGAARGDHHRRGQHQPLQVDREGSLHAGHGRPPTPATTSSRAGPRAVWAAGWGRPTAIGPTAREQD